MCAGRASTACRRVVFVIHSASSVTAMSDTSLTLRGCAGVTDRVVSFPPVVSTTSGAATAAVPAANAPTTSRRRSWVFHAG